jgi:hypothetical protein
MIPGEPSKAVHHGIPASRSTPVKTKLRRTTDPGEKY